MLSHRTLAIFERAGAGPAALKWSNIMRSLALFAIGILYIGRLLLPPEKDPQASVKAKSTLPDISLGFDRNRYPGDAALITLRKTFTFSGYWLNNPPGETSNSWKGKRRILVSAGFGFLVLFNGRLDQELKSSSNPAALGMRDANLAVAAARGEGFPTDTVIFLDQEEGGRLLPEQRVYLYAWIDRVNASKSRAGVYCSGIPAREASGDVITTAKDIRDNSQIKKIVFFVYNDVCPPSTGCALSKYAPSPAQSGVPFAAVWQFAQSPRRANLTASCSATYAADGNCYAGPVRHLDLYVDIDSAVSRDPSNGR
jgi:Domain of unknown function (DUF1906)